MRVLITGGAGFIGQHVTRLLVERGDEVVVALAPGESDSAIAHLDVERVTADLRDLPAVIDAVRGCAAVVNLAAVYALWMKDWRPLYQINVQGTRNVLTACHREGVGKVVHTSSIAALGVEPGLQPTTEETTFNMHGRASHYVLSKYYAEREALEFAERGLPVTIVNPAFPFGVGDHRPTPTGRIVLRILAGTYFAHGPGGINAVDVEDVARGHVLALDKGQPGRRYLLSGTDVTYADLFRRVKELGGIERKSFSVPRWMLIVMGWAGDIVGRFREPLVDSITVRYTSQHLYYDCTRARAELGYRVTPLEDTLSKSIAWFKENDYLAPDAHWRMRLRG